MAAKVNMLKLLQEIRGFAVVANRQPPPRFSGLLLAQIRMAAARDNLRRRRLIITIYQQNSPDMPSPVRIHHVKQGHDLTNRASVP